MWLMLLLRGEETAWNNELLYENFREFPFPHTPTMFALRDSQYKYIFYFGIWDTKELYDLEADPQERTGGGTILLKRPGDWQAAERRGTGDQAGGLTSETSLMIIKL